MSSLAREDMAHFLRLLAKEELFLYTNVEDCCILERLLDAAAELWSKESLEQGSAGKRDSMRSVEGRAGRGVQDALRQAEPEGQEELCAMASLDFPSLYCGNGGLLRTLVLEAY